MEIRVSTRSHPRAVAGAIAHVIREHQRADVQAIGAGAVYQATIAIAVARGYLQQEGWDIICIPAFVDLEVVGKPWTGIKFAVEARREMSAMDAPRPAQVD